MSTTFYLRLVRHGETDANVRSTMESHTPTPLNDTGRQQAAALAAALSKEGATFARVVSSDTQRALETCRGALPETAVSLNPRLRERECGSLHGLPYREAVRRQAEARAAGVDIPGLESPAAAQRRIAEAFHALVEEMTAGGAAVENGQAPPEVIAFSHAGVLHLLLAELREKHGLQLERHLAPGAQLHFSWNTAETRLRVTRGADGRVTADCEYLYRDSHLTGPLAPTERILVDGSRVKRNDPASNSPPAAKLL